MLLAATTGIKIESGTYILTTTIPTSSKQLFFPVFRCEWIDNNQFRPLLFIQPTLAVNHRVMAGAQRFIMTVQRRLSLKRQVLTVWRSLVSRQRRRNKVLAQQKRLSCQLLRRYFDSWRNFSWVRRSQKADQHRNQYLLKNHFRAMRHLAVQRQKAKSFFHYTAWQLQILFMGVYLSQDSYQDIRVAKILSTMANNVSQSPFFYLMRPDITYVSLLTRCTVALDAVDESVLRWLTNEINSKDSRSAHNFKYTLKKYAKTEKCHLWLQQRFRDQSGELGAYVILVHLRVCLAKMQKTLQNFPPADERYRDTLFMRELQQHQIQMLQNPRELETFMYCWQVQHPFYSRLNAERLVRMSLCSLLATRISNPEQFQWEDGKMAIFPK